MPEFGFFNHIKKGNKTDASLFEKWNLESNIHAPNTGMEKEITKRARRIKKTNLSLFGTGHIFFPGLNWDKSILA